jgi:hypothetical protein
VTYFPTFTPSFLGEKTQTNLGTFFSVEFVLNYLEMSSMTKDELRAVLTNHGIELPASSAKKEELVALYDEVGDVNLGIVLKSLLGLFTLVFHAIYTNCVSYFIRQNNCRATTFLISVVQPISCEQSLIAHFLTETLRFICLKY